MALGLNDVNLEKLNYTITVQSPAPEDKVRRCKETIDRKSPVRNLILEARK